VIRLRVRCNACNALTPNLMVLHLGWQSLQCSNCGDWLNVDASPDAMHGKVKRREPAKRRFRHPWLP
jgi:hypothetical protein